MRLERLNPALLYFLSGVTSAAAVNLITSMATANPGSYSQYTFIVAATPWGLGAFFLAWLASKIEAARHDADLSISQELSREEKIEVYRAAIDSARGQMLALAAVIVFCLILGVSLMPYLFSSRAKIRNNDGSMFFMRYISSVKPSGVTRFVAPSASDGNFC